MKALIDGDVIVYQAGFASDQTSYSVPSGFTCQYKKDIIAHCHVHGIDKARIEKHVEAEPVEYCLNSVKKMIKGIMDSIDATEYSVFLTGKGNFREKLFTDYKANRDRAHRPIHYEAIREYLLTTWKADEVVGVEADDALGWAQYKDLVVSKGDQLDGESCICTVDKDLNQIPGWHYNWRANESKGEMYWVGADIAIRYFFEQWLSGDSADNIPGITRVGPTTAERMLDKAFPRSLGWPTAYEYYNYVALQYEKKMPQFNNKFFHIIGDLLWMQRNPGERWDQYLNLKVERISHEVSEA